MTVQCASMWRPADGGPLAQCPAGAVSIMVAGCEHQHVQEEPGCGPCLALMKVMVADRSMECIRCAESRLPHKCTLILLRMKPLPE